MPVEIENSKASITFEDGRVAFYPFGWLGTGYLTPPGFLDLLAVLNLGYFAVRLIIRHVGLDKVTQTGIELAITAILLTYWLVRFSTLRQHPYRPSREEWFRLADKPPAVGTLALVLLCSLIAILLACLSIGPWGLPLAGILLLAAALGVLWELGAILLTLRALQRGIFAPKG